MDTPARAQDHWSGADTGSVGDRMKGYRMTVEADSLRELTGALTEAASLLQTGDMDGQQSLTAGCCHWQQAQSSHHCQSRHLITRQLG